MYFVYPLYALSLPFKSSLYDLEKEGERAVPSTLSTDHAPKGARCLAFRLFHAGLSSNNHQDEAKMHLFCEEERNFPFQEIVLSKKVVNLRHYRKYEEMQYIHPKGGRR